MEAQVTSFEWKAALEGRALLGTHAQPPLISPVSPKHAKTNHSLVAALTVLMVLAVGAILCCCYRWEGQLRGQAPPRSTGHSELAQGTQLSSNSLQGSVPSFSVMMPGDDVPRFVAWAVPKGIPVASIMPEARAEPTPADSHQHVEKISHNPVVAPNSWIRPGRVSG